ncbi:DUF2256 domain-containing protein [Bordetella sp. FB-8]|uniref:DUF2256 domain-containing protein n=1 Tax=Bordetella sp. FB-8 TaxID=1159870 RepID=UPI0009DA430C|nr:DUF2256 domain-containing protein [Bordetella sp. FB-8]
MSCAATKFKKGFLPEKPCERCGRPMQWRHKWARHWDQVKYCSERCRRQRSEVNTPRG